MRCILIILLFLLFTVSCESNRAKIQRLINSNNKDEIIEGYYLMGEQKDDTFINKVFENPYDPRISHHMKFHGISVYQSKMIAMKKISNIESPVEITYEPDSVIVEFYYSWAKRANYLK